VQSTSVPERFRHYVSATEELARRFAAAGKTLYLVGGSVRDALFPGAAEPDADVDLTTDARPEEGCALRHHRRPQGHPGLRDHDAPR
jgi:poly(A) polymerase